MHMHVSVFDSMHCMLQYRSKWIQNKGVCLLVFLIVCTVMSVCSVVYVSVFDTGVCQCLTGFTVCFRT